jgi:glycerophosphoryl diester phosphodiesterase
MSQIKMIAHRGASFIAPENTLAAFRLAWELGADAVETDIRLTRDNRIMCIHDENTSRTTGEDHVVAETDSAILRQLNAGWIKGEKYAGEKIPFLEEVIQEIPYCMELVIELKRGTEVIPFLYDIIKEHGKEKRFSFISFNFLTLREVKRTFRKIPCYWLCSNEKLLFRNFRSVKMAKFQGFNLFYSIVTNEAIERAESSGLEIFSWTVDSPQEASRLISLGVKGIATNRIGWLKNQLEKPRILQKQR